MLIIGLVGGTEGRRANVAAQVLASGRARMGLYSMDGLSGQRQRVYLLEGVLLNFERGRERDKGLILSHVRTLDEAKIIRDRGGFLWHVEGLPSSEIPIMRHDLLVTDRPGGVRHYLDPVEALSEAMLRYSTIAA